MTYGFNDDKSKNNLSDYVAKGDFIYIRDTVSSVLPESPGSKQIRIPNTNVLNYTVMSVMQVGSSDKVTVCKAAIDGTLDHVFPYVSLVDVDTPYLTDNYVEVNVFNSHPTDTENIDFEILLYKIPED